MQLLEFDQLSKRADAGGSPADMDAVRDELMQLLHRAKDVGVARGIEAKMRELDAKQA